MAKPHRGLDVSASRVAAVTLVCSVAVVFSGCAALGFSDEVLWRVASPDGQLIAVCQEVPVFDGPDFDLRLERPDGSFVRHLFTSGDGDPCSELVWSPDGRILAVLTGHAARAKFVDVGWALAHPDSPIAHWSRREVSLSSEQVPMRGHDLRFVAPMTVELIVCPPVDGATGDCGAGSAVKRFDVPESVISGVE